MVAVTDRPRARRSPMQIKLPEKPPIPQDMVDLVTRLRKGRAIELYGNGSATIGSAVEAAKETKEVSKRVLLHNAAWERFSRRWAGRERFAYLLEDQRHWEARKAMIELRDRPHVAAWWFGVSAEARIDMVAMGREERASARRFKLAIKRIRSS